MGYSGKLELKLKARKLRGRGLSIKDIEKRLNVSRSSASIWVRDVVLTKKQINKLYLNRKNGSLKGSYIASINKIKRTKELTDKAIEEGKKKIRSLSVRDFLIAGTAMYFAEGTKSLTNVSFSNSDPRAIKFMANWFRRVCDVPEDKFRCNLYIHDNLNEKLAKKYWAKLINIPLEKFRKSYIVKNNKHRLRKVRHIYGILKITISDANLSRKISGWVYALLQNNNY